MLLYTFYSIVRIKKQVVSGQWSVVICKNNISEINIFSLGCLINV